MATAFPLRFRLHYKAARVGGVILKEHDMKLGYFGVIFGAIFISACATSNYTVGKDFPSENVLKIERGMTTSKDIVALFGEPFSKSVVSENEEKWLYTYSSGTAKAQSYIVSMKVETTGTQKTLDLLLQDEVVVNFTFTEGNNPYSNTIN